MDIINIFNKVKRDLSPINTDIKIASKNTIIFCRFIFDDCDLRVSLNFNDYKMYIYYVDAKKSNDDIISILNGIERKDYDISGYVIFFDIKKIDDNTFLVDGLTTLEELNEDLELGIELYQYIYTIIGFLINIILNLFHQFLSQM